MRRRMRGGASQGYGIGRMSQPGVRDRHNAQVRERRAKEAEELGPPEAFFEISPERAAELSAKMQPFLDLFKKLAAEADAMGLTVYVYICESGKSCARPHTFPRQSPPPSSSRTLELLSNHPSPL